MFWCMMSKQVRKAVGYWMRWTCFGHTVGKLQWVSEERFKSHSLCGDWQAVDRSIVAVFSEVPGPLQLKWILWSRRSVTRIKQSQAGSTLMQMNRLQRTDMCDMLLDHFVESHKHTSTETHTHSKCVCIMVHEVCVCTCSPVPGLSSTLTELIYNVWTPPGGTGPDMCLLSAWLTKLSIESGENLLCFSNASVIMTY